MLRNAFYHLSKEKNLRKNLEENNTQTLSEVISGFKIKNFGTGSIIHETQSLLF